MKTEKVLLSQVKVNKANPRSIKEHKLRLLMERLIVFPKMIVLRPVVVDNMMTALGGNMRVKALEEISQLSLGEIAAIAARTKNFQRLTQTEREALLAHWQKWLDHPTVEIARASELSDAEKQEFVIADNASFGEWDYDALANEWDADDLNSWGVDVWRDETGGGGFGGYNDGPGNATGRSSAGTGSTRSEFTPDDLPPELQGRDMDPDELTKIQGDNETAMERIIIVYPKGRTEEIAHFLGLERIEKVVYQISEIIRSGEEG